MISYVLPTHNRPEALARTLAALGRLPHAGHERCGGGEAVVVDNASAPRASAPGRLENGMRVELIRLEENRGAAGRNVAARAAEGDWLVMLDDDSWPVDLGHVNLVQKAAGDVAAIGGEIVLDDGRHEAGGLPEVFVGCGALIRRDTFLEAGGYDEAFEYYAEEYDLCARLLLGGWRVRHDFRFRVRHAKSTRGRDANEMLRRLVRNNGWVMQRYAPEPVRDELVRRTIERYGRIAVKEGAVRGWQRGLRELEATIGEQARREMDGPSWSRFTGKAAVRDALCARKTYLSRLSVGVVEGGKGVDVVRAVLGEVGAREVGVDEAELVVVGTLSPGPMVDGANRWARPGREVVMPWVLEDEVHRRFGTTMAGDGQPCAAALPG